MNSRSRLIVFIAVIGLFVWVMADALFGSGMFAFRDAAHFYYPLFQFIADEWAAGRVPLWNPYENLGQPLAGNPAASVFYPGKLIFALPISYPWAYKIYIMAHLLLAAWAAYRLARHWQASVEAAGLCALSYAFSGNVLFTYCNVVFLVGAAWLPLALLAADRMLVKGRGVRGQGPGVRGQGPGVRGQARGRVHRALAFGVVLAMMVLGGDPQMAYNAVLLAAMYALWLWRADSPLSLWERVRVRVKQGLFSTPKSPHPGPLPEGEGVLARLLRSRPMLLALTAVIGLALSAVQVLPSMEFTRHSDRIPADVGERFLGHTEPGTHAEHTYHFSVGPWRLAEYLWPNLGGRQFPVHRRWLEVIPAEGRIWTPSLYMGLLPLLLALSAMRFRRRGHFGPPGEPTSSGRREKREERGERLEGKDEVRGDRDTSGRRSLFSLPSSLFTLLSSPLSSRPSIRQRPFPSLAQADPWIPWLSWSVVLSVAAGIGWYGLGWLIHEIRFAAGGDPAAPGLVGDPFGGLYWVMNLLLPGYAYFRYPAKLLVVAALGLSVLAGRGCDRVLAAPSARFRRVLLGLGGLSLCGALAALAVRPFWDGWLSGVAPDPLFGPLDTSGAANDLLAAFLQTAVLCGLFWWLLRLAAWRFRWVPAVALLLSAADLAVANRWLVVTAPATQWQRPSKFAAALPQGKAPFDRGPYRVVRDPIWTPPAWKTGSSPDRLAEAVRWDLDTLSPKYNLADRIPLAEVQGTMMPHDYQTFLSVANAIRTSRTQPVSRLLGRYVVLPNGKVVTAGKRMNVRVEDALLWDNPACLPRAWIVDRVDVLAPLASNDPIQLRRRTEEVLYPNDRPRDLRKSAVIEFSGGACPALPMDANESHQDNHAGQARPLNLPSRRESCRVLHYDPLRVEIEAELTSPGLVVLCDQFYPGWKLEVAAAGQAHQSVPILRTNRVMRGAWLPEGRHRLTYRYRPASFTCGAIISGLAWIGLIAWLGGRALWVAKGAWAARDARRSRRPRSRPA